MDCPLGRKIFCVKCEQEMNVVAIFLSGDPHCTNCRHRLYFQITHYAHFGHIASEVIRRSQDKLVEEIRK